MPDVIPLVTRWQYICHGNPLRGRQPSVPLAPLKYQNHPLVLEFSDLHATPQHSVLLPQHTQKMVVHHLCSCLVSDYILPLCSLFIMGQMYVSCVLRKGKACPCVELPWCSCGAVLASGSVLAGNVWLL